MISLEFKKRFITSIILFVILIIMFLSKLFLKSIMILISVTMIYEFFKLNKNFFLRILIIIYLSFFLFFIIFGYKDFFYSTENKLIFFYPIFISILSDIGGYFFGKTFGGKKLTKISPNKTITGSLGSFLLSLSIVPFFNSYFVFFNIFQLFIFTFFLSFISQIGDLFISYLKRASNNKDTGKLLPGHGGLLDRFDGILFSLPIGFFIFYFFI
jgi:phosphatidate cytidylyltransferase